MNKEESKYLETFATWDKVAKLYQDKFMDLDLYNTGYDQFCKLVTKQNAKILEIGCGPGNITKYLLNKRPDFQIVAQDVSPAMVEFAKQNNPSATFKTFDCRELDKMETKFDAIVCGFCIPYLSKEDCSKLIFDFNKITNDNAIIYLSFVQGDYEQSNYQSGSTGDRTYFYYHSLKDLMKDFLACNFHLLNTEIKKFKRSEDEFEEHTILILRK